MCVFLVQVDKSLYLITFLKLFPYLRFLAGGGGAIKT